MSTRSGRRIHGSFHENTDKPDSEIVAKSEKKTRSRRGKDVDEVILPKSKKRNNYVSYPTEDEVEDVKQKNDDARDQNTLKEQDLNVSVKTIDEAETAMTGRQTRRNKKLSETIHEDAAPAAALENGKGKKKMKKSKKNKNASQVETNENEIPVVVSKKSKHKKKKGKKVNSFTEEVIPENMNKSAGSVDSFHSAAGSPGKGNNKVEEVKMAGSFPKSRGTKRMKADSCEDIESACSNEAPTRSTKKIKLSTAARTSEKSNSSLQFQDVTDSPNMKEVISNDASEIINTTFEKLLQQNRRSSVKNSTFDKAATPLKSSKKLNCISDKNHTPTPKKLNGPLLSANKGMSLRVSAVANSPKDKPLNSTYEKVESEQSTLNGTFEKSRKSRQSVLNSTYEKSDESKPSLNSTFDKNKDTKQSTLNSTFDKSKDSASSTLNSTFDKNKKSRQSLNNTFEKVTHSAPSTLNSTFEKTTESNVKLNSTFDKSENSKQLTLNSTFDKEIKLNSTYEKNENKPESSKSSLISSDSVSDMTSDKSNDNSRISITSDDSRTENIVNTTPVLIESSMDESQIQDATPNKTDEEIKIQPSATPLKREGTFTKDGPEVVPSPRPKLSVNRTPVKRMSLPSPGSTPFPFSKSSQKEKSMMNVTRSIEKATRRSSLAEPSQRTTKVMFCSPVNNPGLVMQQKKKVIKSSMKGSNKSFVFDESASEAPRPGPRKRSYTLGDDDARCKRSRLADPPPPAPRLRTCSATVKLPGPGTPSKKPQTPLKRATPSAPEARPARTRLPDFAALHRREFARMESLDQCQRRRAQRAKQLLTPSGASKLIEKSSPKTKVTTTDAPAVKPVAAKDPAKKTGTPAKTAKLPTLMSLRPGYTRFGFKMHLDANPFMPAKTAAKTDAKANCKIDAKTDAKPRESRPNGLRTREPTQPSLVGATTSRKEAAKQTVMREKSFTSLSDKRSATRTENRSVIKGVRTNRRFELQMMMRNINS